MSSRASLVSGHQSPESTCLPPPSLSPIAVLCFASVPVFFSDGPKTSGVNRSSTFSVDKQNRRRGGAGPVDASGTARPPADADALRSPPPIEPLSPSLVRAHKHAHHQKRRDRFVGALNFSQFTAKKISVYLIRTGLSISTGCCTSPPTLPGPRTPHAGAWAPGRDDDADVRDVRGAPSPPAPVPKPKMLCLEKYWAALRRERRRRFMAATISASSSVVCCRSILFHWTTCTDDGRSGNGEKNPRTCKRVVELAACVFSIYCGRRRWLLVVRSENHAKSWRDAEQGFCPCVVLCCSVCALACLYTRGRPPTRRTGGGGASYRTVP